MSESDAREIREDIRREARAKYATMLSNVSNEVRCIAESAGISAKELVLFVSESGDVSANAICNLLKEETCYYLAAKSEISEVSYELCGVHAAAASNNDVVTVCDGEIVETGTRVNLMDGKYAVKVDEGAGTVTLTRPLTDYVAIPKADHSRLTFGVRLDSETELDAINGGDVVSIVRTKDDRGYDRVELLDTDGMFVTDIYAGSFAKAKNVGNEKEFDVISSRFVNKKGRVVGLDISVSEPNDKGQVYCYAVITLEDVEEFKPEVKPVAAVEAVNPTSVFC
jgi:hypothetical protein